MENHICFYIQFIKRNESIDIWISLQYFVYAKFWELRNVGDLKFAKNKNAKVQHWILGWVASMRIKDALQESLRIRNDFECNDRSVWMEQWRVKWLFMLRFQLLTILLRTHYLAQCIGIISAKSLLFSSTRMTVWSFSTQRRSPNMNVHRMECGETRKIVVKFIDLKSWNSLNMPRNSIRFDVIDGKKKSFQST